MSQGSRKEQPSWPPKSPHEVLLASPSRKKRLLNGRDRDRDISPSPIKRTQSCSRMRPTSTTLSGDEDEDEDEEILQLRLQAIEAKLKLKKLQQAKAKRAGSAEPGSDGPRSHASTSKATSYLKRAQSPSAHVHVPVSPTQERKVLAPPRSPARILLGIDKGLKAQDVSLKRASSFSAKLEAARSSRDSVTRPAFQQGRSGSDRETSRVKSFSERVTENRETERQRQEKQDRIRKSRSQAFDRSSFQSSESPRAPSQQSTSSQPPRSLLRQGAAKSSESLFHSSKDSTGRSSAASNSSSRTGRLENSTATAHRSALSKPSDSTSSASEQQQISSETPHDTPAATSDPSLFESFSSVHLTKRLVPHTTLTRQLDGKAIYTIPQLLKEVKSPHYDPPDVESDYVVLGIIASKSTPLNHKKTQHKISNGDPDEDAEDDQAAGRAKFMVMRLTDLHWELDMFLFATGFSEFWKLTVGTVVAILNPGIMPPKNKDAGNFSLKLSSSEDAVVEIGTARDLGFCNALKKDGKECRSWIDLRKTEICEFHITLAVEKSKRGRMEVNTMTNFGSRSGGKSGMFGPGKNVGGTKRSDELKRHGMWRDRNIHETMYIAPGAADILDAEDKTFGGAMERGYSRAEASRKRFAAIEKERELAKKLGEIGGGMGQEYMRKRTGDPSTSGHAGNSGSNNPDGKRVDAASLGLFNRAADVSLGHANKRKRVLNSGSEPMGWGGAYKSGLPSVVKKPSVACPSPTKKKARFMLEEKGIREPGRESLGGATNVVEDDDDDDDDLEII